MARKFKHFTKKEREIISYMRDIDRKTYEEIGLKLKRSKSAVCMEYNRNKERGLYIANISHDKYISRLHKKDILKIDQSEKIFDYILLRLEKDKWAPDIISARMKNDINCYVSTETIYDYIYNSPRGKFMKLYKLLPMKREHKQKHGSRRKKVCIPNRVSIHQRNPIAVAKKELGHFECDLTFNRNNRSKNIGSLVCKKSQRILLVLNSSKRANTVAANFSRRMKEIPENLRKTLTLDNGKEFVTHMTYRLMGFKTYFCDAYTPTQKGLVEKMNSMIHRLFPKKIDINTLTKGKLRKIEDLLNNMPRKILGYKTPNEVWSENI